MKKILYIFLCIVWISGSYAEESSVHTLKVGTKVTPPFAMKDKEGHWEGISIELWERIAQNLKLDYIFVEQEDIKHLLLGVEDASLDVGIAAITITAQRETQFDFSHSYYTTGLGIVIPKEERNAWMAVLRALFSFKMFLIVSTLVTPSALNIILPKSDPTGTKNQPTTVEIDPDGVYALDGKIIDFSSLESSLIAILNNKEKKGIVLKADKDTKLDYVVPVMDIANRNKYSLVLATSNK